MEIPRPIVIDSSVAVKWLSRENGSDKAMRILSHFQSGEITIYVVDFLFIEVANALLYKTSITVDYLQYAIGLMHRLKLVSVPQSPELLQLAAQIAIGSDVSIYDALPVALAVKLNAVCVTADEKTQYNRLQPKNYPIHLLNSIDEIGK